MKTTNKKMKTEVTIETINGNKKSIRNYAYIIADMSAGSTNAYVMAFDADNDIMWTVQAGDGIETAKDMITWDGVRRVEIYDHSTDMADVNATKTEYVYITTSDSLAQYLSERSSDDYAVVYNTTGKDAKFCADGRDIEDAETALQDMVQSGAVYCSNGDAAHTSDYHADGEAICDAISSDGVIELDADSEDYETASAQLGLSCDYTARIFAAGAFIFSPDALRA